MLALIDSDSIIFNCGFACERASYEMWQAGSEVFGPMFIWPKKKEIPAIYSDLQQFKATDTLPALEEGELYLIQRRTLEPLENCLHLVKTKLQDIIKNTGATSYRVFIKGKGNFRDELAVTRKYKGNRDPSHRPTYEPQIREYLINHWNAEVVDGQEADDLCSILQCEAFNSTGTWDTTVLASPDKDLLNTPGWAYNYHTGIKIFVSELEAWRNFYEQLLSGDSSDNVVGVEGIGKVGAKKLLENCTTPKEMFEICYDKYVECYKEEASTKLSEFASLLYIRRKPEDVWTPPTQ